MSVVERGQGVLGRTLEEGAGRRYCLEKKAALPLGALIPMFLPDSTFSTVSMPS